MKRRLLIIVGLAAAAAYRFPWMSAPMHLTSEPRAAWAEPGAEQSTGSSISGVLPDLGPDADLHGYRPFPPTSAWNTPVDQEPVDPASAVLISSIGAARHLHADFGTVYNGAPNGIPYIVVSERQPAVPIRFVDYGSESDPGPYPAPLTAPIEGGPQAIGDRHVLVLNRDNLKLYELYGAYPEVTGWRASSGAIFDLRTDTPRPAGWTSADAAGLPIFPGLVRYDEVVGQKAIRHALRFTVRRTRRAYVAPARHFASRSADPSLPPMGMRIRLKSSFDIAPYPPQARVILQALKTYGMILADNGSDFFISGAPDPRWIDEQLHTLSRVGAGDLEVVRMGPLTKG